MRRRKTDYGTIILHWLLVAAFGVAFVSGMRIATEAPERTWINWFDSFLPQNVWVIHMQAAVVLVTVSVAYAIYIFGPVLGAASGWTRFACEDLLVEGRQDGEPPTSSCTGSSSSRCWR